MKLRYKILIIVAVIIALMFGIRTFNLSRKAHKPKEVKKKQEVQIKPTVEPTVEPTPTPTYESSLSIDERLKEEKIKKKQAEEKRKAIEKKKHKKIKPHFDVTCKVFTHTDVPKRNVDGSSCRAYRKKVNLIDFGTAWGSRLTNADRKSTTKILVGVDQDDIDEEIADLQSVGWLISHIGGMKGNTAIKFTNLHVIDKLSKDHVALLCSYDWYSVFGMEDTLVVFEDISGSLKVKDFRAGDVFEATAFVHNIKVTHVNGQSVVCVQYNTYD